MSLSSDESDFLASGFSAASCFLSAPTVVNAVKLSDDRFMGFTTDTTEQKAAEQEIAELLEFNQKIMNCTNICNMFFSRLFIR